MAVVYRHIRLDDNSVFYIGIGLNKKRAYETRKRNCFWQNVVKKTAYSIEIIYDNVSLEHAKEIEILLIDEYGRRDLGKGRLVNLTNGGDSSFGFSDYTKNKISSSLKGKIHSEETKRKRSEKLKEVYRLNPDLVELKRRQTTELCRPGILSKKGVPSKKRGISLPDDVKIKVSEGLKRYFKNKKPHNYKIIDFQTLNNVLFDYTNGENKFKLHKKYGISRKQIEKISKIMKVKNVSKGCVSLIKMFEGFSSKPYICPANCKTIGYGSTFYEDGRKVSMSDPAISEERAEQILRHTLVSFEQQVDSMTRDDITQNQFDALVDFAYNAGVGALKSSSLLKKVNANPNDPTIANSFMAWVFGGDGTKNKVDDDGDGLIDEAGEKKKLGGLVNRRKAQVELYFRK